MHISKSENQSAAQIHEVDSGESVPGIVRRVVNDLKHKPGALLPILHRVQDLIGYIPKEAVAVIAEGLQQTRADVHGVISFYHHFRTHPVGSHVVQVCRAESCQSMGSRALEAHIKKRLGIDYRQTSKDNEFTLEPVFCLGNCACAPSIRVGDRIYGRMTPRKFDWLSEKLTTSTLKFQ